MEAIRDIGYRGVHSLEVLSDRYRAMPPSDAAMQAKSAMDRLVKGTMP